MTKEATAKSSRKYICYICLKVKKNLQISKIFCIFAPEIMKKLINILSEQASDGFYSVYTAAEDLPFGVVGEGATFSEAIADFKIVYAEMYRNYVAETGNILNVEFVYPIAN